MEYFNLNATQTIKGVKHELTRNEMLNLIHDASDWILKEEPPADLCFAAMKKLANKYEETMLFTIRKLAARILDVDEDWFNDQIVMYQEKNDIKFIRQKESVPPKMSALEEKLKGTTIWYKWKNDRGRYGPSPMSFDKYYKYYQIEQARIANRNKREAVIADKDQKKTAASNTNSNNPIVKLQELLGGAPESRKLHYILAYKALPGQLFAEPDLIWKALQKKDKSLEVVKKMWELFGNMEKARVFETEEFKIDYFNFDNMEMIAITMPQPKFIPEAYYCILVKSTVHFDFHYYTVEYAGKKIKLGKVDAAGKRYTIGDVSYSGLRAAIMTIRKLHE